MKDGLLRRIGRGYSRLGRNVLAVLVLLCASLAAGLIIVFPLWYTATRHREAYGTAILLLTAAVLGWLLTRRIVRSVREHGSLRAYAARALLPFTVKAAAVAALLLVLYIDLVLYGIGLWVPALLGSLAIAFVLGWLLFGRASSPRNRI